jgi:hypothetical protein
MDNQLVESQLADNQLAATQLVLNEDTLTEVKPFDLDEAKSAYLAQNNNASLSYNFWSFQDVKHENISSKIEKAEAKLEKAESDEDFKDAMKELRRYKRVGLRISRIKIIPIEWEGKTDMREVVIFYDPFVNAEIAMKQTIAVNTIKNLNVMAGQAVDGDKFNEDNLYIRGAAVDIVYEGREKNIGNSQESDRFDIKPSNNQ